MSDEYIFDLHYVTDNGDEKTKKIKIKFVPNLIHEEYGNLKERIFNFKGKWEEFNFLTSKISALQVKKEEGYKEQIKECEAKRKEITDYIMSFSDEVLLKKRFELIKFLLKKNGIKELSLSEVSDDNPDILTYEFWNKDVDPNESYRFLNFAVDKDLREKEEKKKQNKSFKNAPRPVDRGSEQILSAAH